MRKIYMLSTLVFLMLDAYAWIPSSRPGMNAQNDGDISLSIPDFEIHAGKSQEISVDLQSTIDNICQVQFDMTLPEGISIALDEYGEFDVWGGPLIKKSNGYTHEVNAVKQSGGEIRVVVVSSSNTVFKSNNGTLLYITLKADADMEVGSYEIGLSNIVTALSDGTRMNADESTTMVNVLEKLPKSDQSLSLTELPEFTYGDNPYALPSTTDESLPLTWTVDNGTVASVSGSTLTFNGAGTATVTATQAGDDDYNEFSASFQLTVNKAQLTVKADDKTKTAGEANPQLTVSYEGFVNSDDESALTQQPSLTTTADETSVAGEYPITASGADAANYDITYVDGILTVVKAEQSVTFAELPVMTYGDSPYNLPSQADNGLAVTWTSSNPDIAEVSGSTLTLKGAGNTILTATQAGNDFYNEATKAYELTINKASLTITADDKSKTAGEENPELTVTYSGFVNGEDESVLTKSPSVTTSATTESVAGEYPITPSDATADNYEITYMNGTLTVIKADQSLTLAELPSMTYGDDEFTLPAATDQGQPLTWTSNNETVASVSGNALVLKGAGTGTVTATQEGGASHNPFSKTFTLTVAKAQLTITSDAKMKTAGDENPELTVSYDGFVYGEDESVLTKAPTIITTATQGSVAGDYPITASGATAANYEITYVAGTLTVIKADQSVSLTELPAMTYGGSDYTLPALTENGQPLTWTSGNTNVASVSGNTLSVTGAGTATVTATQAGDASHNPFSQTFTLTVSKAALTITADDKTKTAGEANPELTVSYEGFVNGETASVLTKQPSVTTTATTNSVAGDYPITASGATAANYEITYVAGTLTVVKADQSVLLTELPALTYGDEAYTLPAATDGGQPLTWTSGNANVASVSGNTLSVTGAGTATVTASQAGDASHNPFSQTFTLTVGKAALTITADDKTKTAGEANPELTVSYDGFVNGETASVLTKQPTVKTTATANSVAGDYPITVSGAAAANYEITYVAGTLTVVKADQSVSLTELPAMTYGDTDYTLPALTESGQPLTWTSDNAKVAEISGNTLSVTGAGTATVTATQAGDASHNPFSQTFTLTVGKAKLTITADDKSKTAGEANPEFTLSYEGFVNGDDESVLTERLTIACEADENSPAGEYEIVLSGGSSDNYELTLVNGTLTVDAPAHLRGDVNEDGKVDISDVVADINQMAGLATWKYADVNEDGKVNISDIVSIINIMAGNTVKLRNDMPIEESQTLLADDLTLVPGRESLLTLRLDNPTGVSAWSMTVTLPEGVELAGSSSRKMLSSRHKDSHELMIIPKSDSQNEYLLICYDMSLESLAGESGTLVSLRVKADGSFSGIGKAEFRDFMCSDSEGTPSRARDVSAMIMSATTGIVTLETDIQEGTPVYNLSGQRVYGQLHRGIYIVNGQKVYVK